MKKPDQKTTTQSLPQLSAADLQTVSGGRYGVNRPRPVGNRPR